MLKSKARTLYKFKREQLSLIEIDKFQFSLYQQIYALDMTSINYVHVFLSMAKFNEISTEPIINYLRMQGKTIVVSRCNFQNSTLSHFILEETTILEINKFGVPEPVDAIEVNEDILDLIFVPLLISDAHNYRVGYGKGFYDRFLSKCRKNAQKIGLNYFQPISKIIDIHPLDIPLDAVITPKL